MQYKPRSVKQEQAWLAADLRAQGEMWVGVAEVFRTKYRLSSRVALRLAHGGSQRQAADEWNQRWPDEPKTFKNFLYWETLPSPTGGALARFVMFSRCKVNHGPVGVGIEVMTYIADHYRPPDVVTAVGLFGRQNVVHDVDLVVGGAAGTAEEIDLATYSGTPVIPFSASDGTARRMYEQAQKDVRLRRCIPGKQFDALAICGDAEQFVEMVRQLAEDRQGVAL